MSLKETVQGTSVGISFSFPILYILQKITIHELCCCTVYIDTIV